MASIQELTAQVVALTDQVQTLTGRLQVAEQSFTAQVSKGGGSDSGVFDKKRLYPKEFKETTSFRSWAERFIAWLAMDDDEVARAFTRAGNEVLADAVHRSATLTRLDVQRELYHRKDRDAMTAHLSRNARLSGATREQLLAQITELEGKLKTCRANCHNEL